MTFRSDRSELLSKNKLHSTLYSCLQLITDNLLCYLQFGEKAKLYLVRFLNSTVMVRVGGGWITLASFLESNDPCKGMSVIRSTVGFWTLAKMKYWSVQRYVINPCRNRMSDPRNGMLMPYTATNLIRPMKGLSLANAKAFHWFLSVF